MSGGLLLLLLAGIVSCRLRNGPALAMIPGSHTPTLNLPPPAQIQPPALQAQEAPVPTLPPLTPEELKEYHPDETGVVPILEYHDVSATERYLGRSYENFEQDLERLYDEGYRPVNLSEYLSNRIDLPPGKSPVILTFDDARRSQFNYLEDGTLDPNCAIAMLRSFHETHPDWAIKGTFFVLPRCAFEQKETANKKLRLLVAWGCELGNHTLTHRLLHRLSDAQVEKEIGACAAMLHEIVPGQIVDTLAFPGGHAPRHSRLIASGEYKGFHYVNRAGFLAAFEPAPAPVAVNQDRMHIERILACEDVGGITYWLNRIKRGETRRYVSDGDPNSTTVPRKFAKLVDKSRLNGAELRVY